MATGARKAVRKWPTRGIGVAIVLSLVAALGPTASGAPGAGASISQPAAPTLTVEPATGLVDGATVRVTGAGFGPYATVHQCATGATGWEGCDPATSREVATEPGGSLATELRVHGVIDVAGQDPVDCRVPDSCVVLATSEDGNPESTAVAALAFDPAAPVPRPALTVTPETGVVDGQRVVVEGSGFRPGSREAEVYQCGPVPSPATCQFVVDSYLQIAADGTVFTEITVLARLATDSGAIDCRTSAVPCRLVVAESTPGAHWAGEAEVRFDPDAPLLGDPEIAVTPTEGLRDFNTLSVEGRHFAAGGRARVRVCHADDHERCDLDSTGMPTPDETNGFAFELTVWADFVVTPWGGEAVDCRQAPGCVVVATDMNRGLSVSVPLVFGPPDAPRGRYLDPVFDEVEVERDVVYQETSDHQGNPVELKLDIYRPAGDTATRRPAVMWMHGGWFAFGSKDQMADHATEFARRGYVAVSLQYRLRPDLDLQDFHALYSAMIDAYEDARAAVAWLRSHARELGIDPRAIVAGGWSAGAVTATNLAYMPGQSETRRPAPRIAAALPIAGWFVDPANPDIPIPGPFARPDPGEPPAIVFHGTSDQILPVGSPGDLCPLAHEVHIVCEYVGWEGDGHAVLDSRRREVVRRSVDFLAAHVLHPRGYLDPTPSPGTP